MVGNKQDLDPESRGSASLGTVTQGKNLTEGNGVPYSHRPPGSYSVKLSRYVISVGGGCHWWEISPTCLFQFSSDQDLILKTPKISITWKSYLYPDYIAFERAVWGFLVVSKDQWDQKKLQKCLIPLKSRYFFAPTASPHPMFLDVLGGTALYEQD